MRKVVSGILALSLCLPMVGQMTAAVPLQTVAADEAAKNTITVGGLIFELHGDEDSDYAILVGVADISMTSVTIPAEVNGYKVNKVEQDTELFSKCKNLKEINTEDTGERKLYSIDGVLFYGSTLVAYPIARKEATYTIPDGTTSVSNYAFYGTENLISLALADSLKSVGMYTFGNNPLLEEIVGSIPGKVAPVFNNCPSLKAISFSEAKSGDNSYLSAPAFIDCPSLETVVLPKNRDLLGKITFIRCGIKNLNLDENIKCHVTIADCENLQSVEVVIAYGESVDEVSISDCPKLKYIYAENAYMLEIADCSQLQSVGVRACSNIAVENCTEMTALKCYESNNYIKELLGVDNLTVYAEKESSLRQTCDKYSVPFALLEQNTGDANDDGEFNLVDAIMLQKYLLKAGRLTYWKNCDFNGDNEVDVFDLVFMKRALLSGK